MRSSLWRAISMSRGLHVSLYLAVGLVLCTWYVLPRVGFFPSPPLPTKLHAFPLQVGAWEGTPASLEPGTVTALSVDDWMLRTYRKHEAVVWFYIGYYRDGLGFANHHSPDICYPAQGWTVLDRGLHAIPLPGGGTVRVHTLLVQKNIEKRVVLYWHQWGERIMTAWPPRVADILKDYAVKLSALSRQSPARQDRALVRLSAPVVESRDQTLAREIDFLQAALPWLAQHFAGDGAAP